MGARPRLTLLAEIAQIVSLPLAIIATVLAALPFAQAINPKWQWPTMFIGEILAASFKLALALLGGALTVTLWGLRRKTDNTLDVIEMHAQGFGREIREIQEVFGGPHGVSAAVANVLIHKWKLEEIEGRLVRLAEAADVIGSLRVTLRQNLLSEQMDMLRQIEEDFRGQPHQP